MANTQESPVVLTQMRGRDGSTTNALEIPPSKFREAVNVDTYRTGFARKRGGSANIFSTTTSEAFTGVISAVIRHVPGADPTAAELWAIDDAATPVVQRLTGGTAWASPTLVDNVATKPQDVVGASFDGKLFLAYDSTVNRLHCWDPNDSKVRRTGLATPSAPSVADTGSGSYAATARLYKVRFLVLTGSTTLRVSELSDSVSFTPSGSGSAARITKPSSISEDETHWAVYASADSGDTYEQISDEIAVGTTTYDDSVNPADYTGDAPPLAGTHTNWTSVKYVLSTGNSLIGAGAWETGGAKYSRVWYSAFLGQTTDGGDSESVIQTTLVSNYVDLDENDGGEITGLGGPLDGRPLVFKRNQVWRLVPTGLDNPVYQPRPIYKGSGLGCIRHQTIVNAEDEAGRPAVYWLSDQGPYRLGANGPQAMVDDIQDKWDTVNLAASTTVAFTVWYPAKKQIWWFFATGSNNDPDTCLVFDVRQGRPDQDGRVRDGWYEFQGNLAGARCGTLFSNTLGSSMSRDLKPHLGRNTGTVILKADTSDTDDAGTAFQAYVDLPDRHWAGLPFRCRLGKPVLLGSAGSQTIKVTLTPNYGEYTGDNDTTTMAASGSETRVLKTVEGVEQGDAAHAVKIRVGDASANTSTWTLDALLVPVERAEQVTP